MGISHGPGARVATTVMFGLTLLGCQSAPAGGCGDGDSCSLPPFVVEGISYDLTCGSTLPVARLGRKLADVDHFSRSSPVREVLGVPVSTLVAIQVGGSDGESQRQSVPCGQVGDWLPGLPIDGDFRDSVLALCAVADMSAAQRAVDFCPTPTPTGS